jgi:hypothetical protein
MRADMNVLDLRRNPNQWVVLDRGQNVIDHGQDLQELYARHKEAAQSLTFYFATASMPTGS